MRDMLLGSTAEKALLESACSVLAVKPGEFDHPHESGEQAGTKRASVRA